MGARTTAAILAVLVLAAPATAASTRPAEVANALRSQPVYVAPARTDQLGIAAVGRLQIQIAQKDPGRIHIAVIPAEWATEDGSIKQFAHDVDAELNGHGALLISADDDAYIVTSHEHSDEAVGKVEAAYNSKAGGLEGQLRRSINGLTEIDPGRSGDINNESAAPPGSTIDFPDPTGIVKDVTHTIKWVIIAIVATILAPFVFFFLRGLIRARQNYEDDKEAFDDDLQAVRAERDKLGDDIVDLDTATSMPNVPPSARAAYEKALDAYESSELKLKAVDSRRRLTAVQKLIADGRAAAALARQQTGG